MSYIGNKVIGKDQPPSTDAFEQWLKRNHPELLELYVSVDRRSMASPEGEFGLINWLIQLAFECGSLHEIQDLRNSLKHRKSIGTTDLFDILARHEETFNHRHSFDQ